MHLARSVCLLLGGMLVLTACGNGDGEPTDGDPATTEQESLLPEPDEVVTIRPLDAIDGAERVVVEGVGVDVPAGVEAETTRLSDEVTQMVARSPEQDRAHLILTVTQADAQASDADVFLNMRGTAATLSPEAVPVRREVGLSWEGFPPGWGLLGEVDPGTGDLREFMYTVVRDEAGSRIVGVSVEAAEGAVEDSLGHEMLRTVRIDEG